MRIRLYHLLRALSKQNEIHLLSFVRTGDQPSSATLRDLCATIRTVPWREFRPTRIKALGGFISPMPRSLVDTYNVEMAQRVCQSNETFDVVIASTIDVARYALDARAPVRVLEEHNFTTRWMWDEYRAEQNPLVRARRWLSFLKYRRYEKWLFDQFNACTMVSDLDAAWVHAWFDYAKPLRVIPNGVELEYYALNQVDPQPNRLVFNGSLTYAANLDAMRFFVNQIWPAVKSSVPEVTLSITGSTQGLTPAQLPRGDGITLTGYLNDLRPTVGRAWACVVPLRTGGGTRLKILEAMALGAPVISTSKGAEGLAVTHGENILIVDDPKEFAEQTVRLLRDPQLRARLVSQARQLVQSRYDWQAIGADYGAFVQGLVNAQ